MNKGALIAIPFSAGLNLQCMRCYKPNYHTLQIGNKDIYNKVSSQQQEGMCNRKCYQAPVSHRLILLFEWTTDSNNCDRQYILLLLLTDFQLIVIPCLLSNLLLDAGCLWPVIFPLRNITLDLGTGWWWILSKRWTWMRFLQARVVIFTTAQKLFASFLQEFHINFISGFL